MGEEVDLSPPPPSFVDKAFDTADDPAIPAVYRDLIPYSVEEPWGMMEGEREREYQLFSYYRSLGLGRVKGEVAKHFEISGPYIYRIAKENDWDSRVRAWDIFRERIYTAELTEETREMAKVQANIARKGLMALGSAFEALVTRMEADPELWQQELDEIPTKQLMMIAQRSAQVIPNLMNAERLSRGMPTDIIATHTVVDHNVNVQTSDDLFAILTGLFGAIGPGRDGSIGTSEEDVIDAVVVDDRSGEDPSDEDADSEAD